MMNNNIWPPIQQNMNDPRQAIYYASLQKELPPSGCGEACASCLCPCYVFGRLVNTLRRSNRSVNWVACGSWALFTLVIWGGVAGAVQIVVSRVLSNSNSAQYAIYGLYALYYFAYMYPYLQAMIMYRSLKAIHNTGDPPPAQAVVEAAAEPCHQWCVFMICPCSFLGSAETYVRNVQRHSSVYIHLDKDIAMCPLNCIADYGLEVRAKTDSYATAGGGLFPPPTAGGFYAAPPTAGGFFSAPPTAAVPPPGNWPYN
jgi:hypothetical protein